jgi:3-phenylpropionate/trans-cinnamate dioxygenase ferredoxin reductase subunit
VSEAHELLVIGGGPTGLAAVRAFRESDGEGRVAIVTDEGRMPYERPPLSKQLLRQEMSEDEIQIEEESWLDEQDVDLITGRAVVLDPEQRRVELSGGRRLEYRTCLLATGAEPIRLPVPGADHPGVRVLRALDDLRELRARLAEGADVVVIGSGFIGCEIAASLRMLGHPVSIVSDEPAPNARRLGDEAAAEIGGWLSQLGVRLRLDESVEAIERVPGGLAVRTGKGTHQGTVVVMAAGVAPRSELARQAGVELDGGAVPTDSAMRTAADGVLAAGDVCVAENASAGRRLRVEHWGDALGQGAVAGRTAAGRQGVWDEVPGFWSTIGEHTLKYAAWGDGFDQVRFEPRAAGGFVAWYGLDGRTVGVLSHEDDDAYSRGRELIEAGASWN